MSFFEAAKAAKAVGLNDFGRAIAIYERILAKNPGDELALLMIAQCYDWKGEIEKAMVYVNELLVKNPINFQALSIAARYWDKNEDIERTYQYACRMVDNPPDKLPEVPAVVKRIIRCFSFLPPFRSLNQHDPVEELAVHEKENENWLTWAKEYKKWYEGTHDEHSEQSLH